MNDCRHEALSFASGGFYVVCAVCRVKWVACGIDSDQPKDHQSSAMLGATDLRTVPRGLTITVGSSRTIDGIDARDE